LDERTLKALKRAVANFRLEFRKTFYDFDHYYWCCSAGTKNNLYIRVRFI